MNFAEYNNSIFIIKDNSKKSLLDKLNAENKLINIKLITLSELKKKYIFDYDKKTIYYIVQKYKVIPEIAKIYIENLYFLKDLKEDKIDFLNMLKTELEGQGLIKINKPFRSYFVNKKIVLYNLKYVDKFYKNLFKELKSVSEVIEYNDENETTIKPLYQCINKNEEISFIASEICKLIKEGIDINRIKLANVQKDYIFTIKKTFNDFNIPIELPNDYQIEGTLIINKFKEFYDSNIETTFEKLRAYIKDKKDEKIYSKLISIVNEYSWVEDYRDVEKMIFSDLKTIKITGTKYKNAVRIIDFIEDIITTQDYVFLINFNQGVIPVNSKDEDYLNDNTKKLLDLSTSVDLNTSKTEELQRKIAETSNLVVTYSSHSLTSELYISNAYMPELFIEQEPEINYSHSNDYNRIKLLCAKDENKKFGTITEDLITLNKHYENEDYCSFDNQFTNIEIDKLHEHMKNKLTLSYSSMNTYYQCSFRYYLDNILKINKFEDSFATIIGNLFHKILSECFQDNYDLDESWKKNIELIKFDFKNSEKYFLYKLKDELKLIIDTINNHMEHISLKKALYEHEIIVPVSNNTNVVFKGFIDKILYENFGSETVVAIIDYKTGDPELNIDNAFYGIGMQLPVYIYLIKNSSKIKNVRIGGFYLQKILNVDSDPNKRIANLKLQGYSNANTDILSKVDDSYTNSQVIKSMKTTSNGFAAYSKILTDQQIDKLSYIVENKIKEASKAILDGKFNINPKQIADNLVGCKFCKYSDICHMKNADIVKYKKVDKNEFLGGE